LCLCASAFLLACLLVILLFSCFLQDSISWLTKKELLEKDARINNNPFSSVSVGQNESLSRSSSPQWNASFFFCSAFSFWLAWGHFR
jgi:hypothetical protein